MSEFEPVTLSSSTLELEILPRGLAFNRLVVKAHGKSNDILIGPEEPKEHLEKKYTNTIVGRYANRIPVGSHDLERHGIKSIFVAQANENPRVSLHGGPVGFDSVVWTLSNAPKLFSKKELAHFVQGSGTSSSVFHYSSPDGDQGYPGELHVEVLVALLEPKADKTFGSLIYVYRAKVDNGVTPVNLTQHWGFNLEASLGESLDVGEHVLTIKADRIVARNEDSLHTGSYIPVSGEPAHAHNSKKIKEGYPAGGYDDYYVFEHEATGNKGLKTFPLSSFGPDSDLLGDILEPKASTPLVELSSEKSGLKITFDSNQSGAMFYSNGLADGKKGSRKKIHGGTGPGDSYPPGTAVFLEFHGILTAFLDPANKDKDDTLLTADEIYHNYVRCDIINIA